MAALRYGIIGCGVIGPVHAEALARLPEARLVGVCDIARDRAERVAAASGAEYVTTDAAALLARADIDAVCICTPHHLHAEMAIVAAQAGKHVFCEKPMAIAPSDMDAMLAAADRAGVQLGVCLQHRFDPAIVQLKRLIDDGRFGRLLLGGAHCQCFRGEDYYRSAAWRGTRGGEGGGVCINQAIHTIDLLLWLFGEATEVSGICDALRWGDVIEVEDTATALIRFRSGAQGHIAATSAGNLDWHTRLQVFGSDGAAIVSTGFPDEFLLLETRDGAAVTLEDEEPLPEAGKACYGNSHIRALRAFTRDVLAGRPFPLDGREGRRSAEAVLALYRSAECGAPVPV